MAMSHEHEAAGDGALREIDTHVIVIVTAMA